jgi:hypothetical protein
MVENMSEAMRVAASLYNNPRYFSESEERIRRNLRRRQRIVRRQYTALAIIAAIVIFTLCFSFSTILSGAEGEDHVTNFKYYKTVTIHTGDSVWSIANDNYDEDRYKSVNDYIREIYSINGLDTASVLNAGESLIIPYYSTEYR